LREVDAFVDAVLAEPAAMAADGTRSTRSGPKPPLTGAGLRKAIMTVTGSVRFRASLLDVVDPPYPWNANLCGFRAFWRET
jgi:hypothetical protein